MGCGASQGNEGDNDGGVVSRSQRKPDDELLNPLVVVPTPDGGGGSITSSTNNNSNHGESQQYRDRTNGTSSSSSSVKGKTDVGGGDNMVAYSINRKSSGGSPHSQQNGEEDEDGVELESISSSGSMDEDDELYVTPGAGGPTGTGSTGSGSDDANYTPTIFQLNKRIAPGLPGMNGINEDVLAAGGPQTTASLIPQKVALDHHQQKDAIYLAMGVDNSTALVTYSIAVPGARNGIGAPVRVPNADDEIGMVSNELVQEMRRSELRAEEERLKKGRELALTPLHSVTPVSPASLSSSGPGTPMMPLSSSSQIGRVKRPKLANMEPYLRYVSVTMMSTAAVNSRGKRIKVLVVSEDEKELAWCTCEDTTLYIANIPSNRAVGQFVGHSDRILGAALAPVGVSYYVATASVDRFCIVWDRNKGQLNDAKLVLAHTQTVVCVSFSHDFKYLVTACQDKCARIYNARNGECVVVYKGHSEVVFHCGYSPDDQFVSSCSFDLTVHMWSSKNGRARFVFRGHTKIPMMSNFTRDIPDAKRLVSNDDKEVRVWDIKGNRGCVRIFKVADVVPPPPPPAEGAKAKVYGWTFCSVAPGSLLGTNHFVVGCTNGVVYLYNMDQGLFSSANSGQASSARNSPGTSSNNSFSRTRTDDTQVSSSSINTRQASIVVSGVTAEGVAYSQADEEACLYATKAAEVWSYQCRGAVYAIHCGPTHTIACGDLLGNVYILKLEAGS